MFNASFEQGILPDEQRRAVTRPILQKPSLDPLGLNSYRPISNLSFVSKMVERDVDSRFIFYAEELQEIFERAAEVKYHLFANDMQGHRSSQPQSAAMTVSSLQDCVVAVSKWCGSKRLQLKAKKTELLRFGSVTELRKVDLSLRSLTVGTNVIQQVDVVRDLGVYFDSHLTMKAHVARVARTCFYHLRRQRSIRRSLGRDVTAQLVSALVISRLELDYCNSVLTHLPASTFAPLQRVRNAAVWLVHDWESREHVTPVMSKLHWLPIAVRIKFKPFGIPCSAPSYLTELVTPVENITGRASHRSAGRHDLVVLHSRLVSSERAFSVAALRAWNSLSVDIRLITDTKLFKKNKKNKVTWPASAAWFASDMTLIVGWSVLSIAYADCISGRRWWLSKYPMICS